MKVNFLIVDVQTKRTTQKLIFYHRENSHMVYIRRRDLKSYIDVIRRDLKFDVDD